MHRLDKETSGIIVFAKNEATHKYLSQAFEERTVEKYYEGIVKGTPAGKRKNNRCTDSAEYCEENTDDHSQKRKRISYRL